jgi:hypothetical protein
MERQIDRAIPQTPRVLLILSKSSLQSDWLEHEVEEARKLEKERECRVLCPVALDDSWKDGRLPGYLMEYNILDVSAWKKGSQFDPIFRQLMDALELFDKR